MHKARCSRHDAFVLEVKGALYMSDENGVQQAATRAIDVNSPSSPEHIFVLRDAPCSVNLRCPRRTHNTWSESLIEGWVYHPRLSSNVRLIICRMVAQAVELYTGGSPFSPC